MIYEVKARLFFDEEDEARDFYHDCVVAHLKARDVNPDTEAQEISYAQLIENHHEDDPNHPCHIVNSIP